MSLIFPTFTENDVVESLICAYNESVSHLIRNTVDLRKQYDK